MGACRSRRLARGKLSDLFVIILNINDRRFIVLQLILFFCRFLFQYLNPTEFLENIVIQYEYVECTATAMHALVLFSKLYPQHRRKEIEAFIVKGVHYIEDIQMPDGILSV